MIWFTAVLSILCGAYADGTTDSYQTVDTSLNPLDVPIFYNDNPLMGLKAFTVIVSFSLKDGDIQKKIKQSVESTLKGIGAVVHLKDNDMRGFGAGNILLIQMGGVTGWDGNKMSISRLSLSVESPVTLDKTGVKTFPMVWSINTFMDSSSEGNLTGATQKLIADFVLSYQYANRDQTKKPVFYIYE